MANISDRSMGKLRSVGDSYIRYETLTQSNDKVSNAIATLPIFAYYHITMLMITNYFQVLMVKNLSAALIRLRRVIHLSIFQKAKGSLRSHWFQTMCLLVHRSLVLMNMKVTLLLTYYITIHQIYSPIPYRPIRMYCIYNCHISQMYIY